jgi:signal transduction histidine kinase
MGRGETSSNAGAIPRQAQRFASSLLAPLADGCAVVVVDDGGAITQSFAAHAREALVAGTRRLAEAMATSTHAPLGRLVARERPFVLAAADEPLAAPELRHALAAIDARSVAVVPMQRSAVGFVVFVAAAPGRWTADDLPTLRALGDAVAALVGDDDIRTEAEELIADIHHDLGNPLHAISLNLEFLLSMVPEDDRRSNRVALETLRQTARRMSQLLAELDEYLHGREHPDAAGTTVVARAIDEVVATLTPLAGERSIRLVSEADPATCIAIPPRQLYRVLANLVGNAIKYADAGTVVRVAAVERDGRVQVAVEDRGPGIARDDCARLFDRDWLATSALRKGKGLGLAIAKRLVEAHGGAIAVASELGGGSRFVVDLAKVPS